MYANQTLEKFFYNVTDMEYFWVSGEEFFIRKMMDMGAIPAEGSLWCRKCSRCPFSWKQHGDRHFWVCRCGNKVSIYRGTIFEECNRKKELVQLLILFLHNSPNKLSINTTRLSHKRVSENYQKFAKIISNMIDVRPKELIGGKGSVVQIDESMISKRKHHRGHRMANQKWLFGGIDTTTNKVFFVDVEKRNKNTLFPIILDNIDLGTEIWSDGWAAYQDLPRFGYSHEWVNHKQMYVRPDGMNTNKIEAIWGALKRDIPRRRRSQELFKTALQCYVFKRECRLNGVDPLVAFFQESLSFLVNKSRVGTLK